MPVFANSIAYLIAISKSNNIIRRLSNLKVSFMRLILAGFILFLTNLSLAHEGHIEIHDAWVRSVPPNASATAAFMRLENRSDTEVRLIKAVSKLFGRVELHRTQMVDGMMKMLRQKNMPIPANGVLTLKPGSWHIMLLEPKKIPAVGDKLLITLFFDNETHSTIEAVVKSEKLDSTHKHH